MGKKIRIKEISLFLGGFVAYTGQDFNIAYDMAIQGGGAILIQNTLKSIFKW